MSQAQIILQKFINQEFDAFNFQKSLFAYYKESERTEEIKQEILEIIKLLDKNKDVRKDMWRVFFAPDREMYRKIDLLEVQLLALSALEDNIKEPHPILLKTSASLAWANCDRASTGNLDKDKMQIWIDTFKDFPEFKVHLDNEIQRSEDFELKCKADYPDYYNEIEKIKNLPIVESYQIYVPVKSNSTNPSIWTSKEMGILIQEISKSFDDIGLEGYMKSFENKSIHSHIEFNNGFIFTFDCYKKIKNLNEAKEDFIGQLSDGWGEGASQISILIGKEIVSLDWDFDSMSDFIIKTPKTLNNKPK
jgi:hypothetical protein